MKTLQTHRTPFTSSRFTTFGNDAETPTTLFSVPPAQELYVTGDDTRFGQYDSPWDRSHEDDNYQLAPAPYRAPETRTSGDDARSSQQRSSQQRSSHRRSGQARSSDFRPTEYSSPTPLARRSVPATHFFGPTDPYLFDAAPVVSTPDEVVPVRTRRTGSHRIPAPPSALKGRVAVVAVAAGAVVAAGQAALNDAPADRTDTSDVALAAGEAPVTSTENNSTVGIAMDTASVATVPTPTGPVPIATSTGMPVTAPYNSTAPQILNVASVADMGQFGELLAKGQRFAQERAAEELAKLRPLFVLPALGTYTSGYGSRWGTLHAGVDIANAIGTPILAVADGVVIDSGPASGFGMWVRLLHADGTITVYGHISATEVTKGQTVMAGDEIAKMGNNGQSTGPHLHFEVHLAGENKIDPMPWLATRGISLGPERD